MDKETVLNLAQQAGMVVYEGAQNRVLFDGSPIEALQRFAALVLAYQAAHVTPSPSA